MIWCPKLFHLTQEVSYLRVGGRQQHEITENAKKTGLVIFSHYKILKINPNHYKKTLQEKSSNGQPRNFEVITVRTVCISVHFF